MKEQEEEEEEEEEIYCERSFQNEISTFLIVISIRLAEIITRSFGYHYYGDMHMQMHCTTLHVHQSLKFSTECLTLELLRRIV